MVRSALEHVKSFVSMPFKRAVVLLFVMFNQQLTAAKFQCPLSGQLCCCKRGVIPPWLRSVSMPFKRAVVLLFPCPRAASGLSGVSMPFKRAVVLL